MNEQSNIEAQNPPLHKADVVRSAVFNDDCMTVMKRYPDKIFDLAIVDPPYGILAGLDKRKAKKAPTSRNSLGKWFNTVNWDDAPPDEEYFKELFRVSKNQIIFGGNYFELPPTRCLIVWDKMTYVPTMSQIEIAWTSFNSHSRLKKINSNQKDRIHPSQKPVELYGWLLKEYAKENDLILDTHLGSGSSRIACHKAKMNFIGCEKSKKYYEEQEVRFKNFISQQTLW